VVLEVPRAGVEPYKTNRNELNLINLKTIYNHLIINTL